MKRDAIHVLVQQVCVIAVTLSFGGVSIFGYSIHVVRDGILVWRFVYCSSTEAILDPN